MRKILIVILTLCIVLALALPALADNLWTQDNFGFERDPVTGEPCMRYASLAPGEPEPPKPEFPKWAAFTVGDKRYYSAPAGQEMWENRPYLFQRYSNAADFTKWEQKADVATFAENGRTYVPMRFLAYALGATDKDVTWDDKAQTVKIVLKTAGDPAKSVTVTLKVGSKTLLKDGQAVAMDVSPLAKDGRVFLPARFVAEAAGYAVSYDEDYQGVLVGPSPDKMPVHPKRMTPPDRPEVIIPEDGGEVGPFASN